MKKDRKKKRDRGRDRGRETYGPTIDVNFHHLVLQCTVVLKQTQRLKETQRQGEKAGKSAETLDKTGAKAEHLPKQACPRRSWLTYCTVSRVAEECSDVKRPPN